MSYHIGHFVVSAIVQFFKRMHDAALKKIFLPIFGYACQQLAFCGNVKTSMGHPAT
jgi:hypothetical protein